MSSPTVELQILLGIQAALSTIPDVTVELMPTEPGQDGVNLPTLQLFPGDSEKASETTSHTDYNLVVEVSALVSAEQEDVVAQLYTLLGSAIDAIILARKTKFGGIAEIVDVSIQGMSDPMSAYRGTLNLLARSINLEIHFRSNEDNS